MLGQWHQPAEISQQADSNDALICAEDAAWMLLAENDDAEGAEGFVNDTHGGDQDVDEDEVNDEALERGEGNEVANVLLNQIEKLGENGVYEEKGSSSSSSSSRLSSGKMEHDSSLILLRDSSFTQVNNNNNEEEGEEEEEEEEEEEGGREKESYSTNGDSFDVVGVSSSAGAGVDLRGGEARRGRAESGESSKSSSSSSSSRSSRYGEEEGRGGDGEGKAAAGGGEDGGWACPSCTFRNTPHRSKCDMCTTENPHVPPRRSQRDKDHSQKDKVDPFSNFFSVKSVGTGTGGEGSGSGKRALSSSSKPISRSGSSNAGGQGSGSKRMKG